MLFCLLAAGCRPRGGDDSVVLVTNGVETNERPEVVKLVNTRTGALCTGTFVGPRVVLTAAHCFTDKHAADLSWEGLAPIHAWHGGRLGDLAALTPEDVAVIAFTDDVAPGVAPVAATRPAAGERIEVFGYGRLDATDQATSGVKRRGVNTVAEARDGFLIVEGVSSPNTHTEAGENAVGARGDSGGPLFVKDAVAGVDSGGGKVEAGRKRTKYVDITAPAAHQVLCQAIQAGVAIAGMSAAVCD